MDTMTAMALSNWDTLNKMLTSFNEDQVKAMLDHEMTNSRRKVMVKRLHQRFTILRAERERAELLGQL